MRKRCRGCGKIVKTDKTHHYIPSGRVVRNNDLGGSANFPPLKLCGELIPVVKYHGVYKEAKP